MREQISTSVWQEQLPSFETDREDINHAWDMAVRDLLSNVCLYQDGLLKEKAPVMLAGSRYDTPWTRDASINTWNAGALLIPDVAKNTMLSVLTQEDGACRVGGQYWDAIIWVVGAYHYYLCTGDEDFFPLMVSASENSLAYFEETEFDPEKGLFRGPACYGDGVAAYPDRYVTGESGIRAFPRYFQEKCASKGEGIPCFTLSTNCLYAESYRLAYVMTGKEEYLQKHNALKTRINEVFWNEEKGRYDYLVDPWGREVVQEALGESFAILFGIADETQKKRIVENCVRTPNGIPCIDVRYERYTPYGIGRHCGTVWPFAQAFLADAAAAIRPELFSEELEVSTKNALRAGQFAEIFHPETGEPYGGVQEAGGPISDDWHSVPHQTWSATGYLRMLLKDLAGLHFEEKGIRITPVRIPGVSRLSLKGLHYRDAVLDISIGPDGWEKNSWVPADSKGSLQIRQ